MHVQMFIEKKMISIPNGEDTVDFDAFPTPYIKLISVHLRVSEWNRRRACTASYTPSPIDSAVSWRMGGDKHQKGGGLRA